MSAGREWLIFCLRRGQWWGADCCGYTSSVSEAGRYSDAEALGIAERMNHSPRGDHHVKLVPLNALWVEQ